MDSGFRNTFYLNNKMQSIRLEFMLEGCESFDEFEKQFSDEFLADDNRAGTYLERLMLKYDKANATLSKEAGLATSYVGHIVNGKREPSRDALIAICLAMRTSLEELQDLLKYAGHAPLYVRRKRDVIIWFGIMKRKSIIEIDIDLYDHGYKTFFKHE